MDTGSPPPQETPRAEGRGRGRGGGGGEGGGRMRWEERNSIRARCTFNFCPFWPSSLIRGRGTGDV